MKGTTEARLVWHCILALIATTALSFGFNSPSYGQSMPEKFGYPDTPQASFQSGALNIPCIRHVKDGAVSAYFEADLAARNGQFPITFEVTRLISRNACEGMTALRGDTLTGIVLANGVPFPYLYTLKYKGTDNTGKMTLVLDAASLYKIVNTAQPLVGTPGARLEMVPATLNLFASYELRDISTNEVLNTLWGFRSSFNSVTFVPNVAQLGTVMLVDHDQRTVQFIAYDVRVPTSPVLSLLKKSSIGGGIFGTPNFVAETIPSICQPPSCSSTVNATILGSSTYEHRVYKLSAQGGDFVVKSIAAKDLNGVTSATISGLTSGTTIKAGSEVQFTLNSGLTRGQEALLQWTVEVEGLNVVLLETIRFSSN